MIRGPGKVEERDEAGQVLRERYVLSFLSAASENGGLGKSGMRKKRRVKYFPPVAEEMGGK